MHPKPTISFELLFETGCCVAKDDLDLQILLLCLWSAGIAVCTPTPGLCGARDQRQVFAGRSVLTVEVSAQLRNHRHSVLVH